MDKELEELLQRVGDNLADFLEQVLEGNYRDELGHSLELNIHVLNLENRLWDIAEFRAKHLGYTEVNRGK